MVKEEAKEITSMKYTVTYSCGHTEEVQLFGPMKDREYQLDQMRKYGLCKACREAQHNAQIESTGEYNMVTMLYRDYKNEYADCKTKAGTYDKVGKTIVVYVPVNAADRG